jgi:putative SOS response-associated peptidase YedK
MCGKFTVMMTWREYCDLAEVSVAGADERPAMAPETALGVMTPMRLVPVLHLGPVRQRRVSAMRWGWLDRKAKDPLRGFSHLHARAETIDTAPTWSQSFLERRGVVLVRSFNIGEDLPNGKVKQWVCARADGKPLAIAVIHQSWPLETGPLAAFAMVTTAAAPPLDARDSRMPALLDLEEVSAWLGERAASAAELKALLRPYAGALVMREQEPQRPKASRNTTKARPPDSRML